MTGPLGLFSWARKLHNYFILGSVGLTLCFLLFWEDSQLNNLLPGLSGTDLHAYFSTSASSTRSLSATATGVCTATTSAYATESPTSAPTPSTESFYGLSYLVRPSTTAPLRRHAIILTGAIRTLSEAFPSTLDLLNATPGGFDVYAVLSPTRGGWNSEDRGIDADYESLMWLKSLPERDPRISIQLLVFDDRPSGYLSSDVLTLFPSAHAYSWRYANPIAELLTIWKQYIAIKVLEDHCSAMPRSLFSAWGSKCYDMMVRVRPDIFFNKFDFEKEQHGVHLGPPFDTVRSFSEKIYASGINLDEYWKAWDRTHLLSSYLPYEIKESIARTDTWAFSSTDGPACGQSNTNSKGILDFREFFFLPIFSPAHGNDWGGPNDNFIFGPFESMHLYFSRASMLEKLNGQIFFTPEGLVRCGMMEALRTVQTSQSFEEVLERKPKVIEHIMLSLGYCRRKTKNTVYCAASNDLGKIEYFLQSPSPTPTSLF